MVRRRARSLTIVAVLLLVGAVGIGLYAWGSRRDRRLAGPDRVDASHRDEAGEPAGGAAGTEAGGAAADIAGRPDLGENLLPGADMVLQGTSVAVPGPSGDTEWTFSADRIEVAAAQRLMRLTRVEGARHVAGAREVRVRAGSLTADLDSGRIDFDGGVYVAAGERGFSAQRASWDARSRAFSAFGDVRYWDGEASLSGDEIRADAEIEGVTVKGGVRFRAVVRRK